MDGAIRAPIAAGHGSGLSGLVIAVGTAIGVIAGVALALSWNALREGNLAEIGPFGAPTELCRFNTFNQSETLPVSAPPHALPAMASRCDYFFKEPQYMQVGYRI